MSKKRERERKRDPLSFSKFHHSAKSFLPTISRTFSFVLSLKLPREEETKLPSSSSLFRGNVFRSFLTCAEDKDASSSAKMAGKRWLWMIDRRKYIDRNPGNSNTY